jgi:hypothetical protein
MRQCDNATARLCRRQCDRARGTEHAHRGTEHVHRGTEHVLESGMKGTRRWCKAAVRPSPGGRLPRADLERGRRLAQRAGLGEGGSGSGPEAAPPTRTNLWFSISFSEKGVRLAQNMQDAFRWELLLWKAEVGSTSGPTWRLSLLGRVVRRRAARRAAVGRRRLGVEPNLGPGRTAASAKAAPNTSASLV